MSARFAWWGLMAAAGCLVHCSAETLVTDEDAAAEAEIALTNGPTNVACLRLTIAGESRTDVRTYPVTSAQHALFRLNGLPVGNASFSADAFPTSCNQVANVRPTSSSDPIAARLDANETTHVSLGMLPSVRISSPVGATKSALMD